MLEHKHLIIRAEVLNAPKDINYMNKWFHELIKEIDMKILMGPYLVYLDKEGNRGFTGAAIIETSHIVMHTWDECSPSIIQLDVYSCKDFDKQIVLDKLKEFDISVVEYKLLDRENNLNILI